MPHNLHDKLLIWGIENIEQNTLDQATKTAQLPFVEKPLALMPDAHFGIGSTVGSVIATSGVVVPSAVGSDIGCGCAAAPIEMTSQSLPDDLTELHNLIAQAIPAGVGKGKKNHTDIHNESWSPLDSQPEMLKQNNKLWRTTVEQHGTLGSGNHFVEICLDEGDKVWLVLHSGSRGVGNQIARRHIDGAKSLMKRYFIDLEDKDLSYFVQNTPEFDSYIHDMLWAQDYAASNRKYMLLAALWVLEDFLGHDFWVNTIINCHHNYTEMENHHGRDLWVTRKGAIRARVGDKGIIPGSMATGSYIVEGLGNPASYCSASHGAGRRMSRKKARESVTEQELNDAMKNITWNNNAKALLDEAPEAYKDLGSVMDAQKDLVQITHRLNPILNFKGV